MIGTIRQGFALTGKAFEYLSREVRGMHAAAYMLALSSLVSSLLALFRDRLLAHTFGAGHELDLYYAAFRIPDLLFVGIGSLVSAYVLIPVLAGRDEEGQRRYIDAVLVTFSLVAISACGIAAFFSPALLSWLFPTLSSAPSSGTLLSLTLVLLIQPVLLGLSNILAAVTQFRHRYALYACAPILYNLGIIVGIVLLYPRMGLIGLAWGVCLGALLHGLIQFLPVLRDGYMRSFSIRLEFKAILETTLVSIPRALALSMAQLAFLGLLVIAGSLAQGSIAIFMLAFNLQAVPLAIIGASYSVAAFPTLAQLSRDGSREFVNYVATAARHIFFWSMPALCLAVVLRAHIVRVILGSGEFDWTDTRLTAAALALFVVSLAAQGVSLLLVRAYYAAGKTSVPLFISGLTALGTLALGILALDAARDARILLFLESLLRVDYVPGAEMLALPFSYALASIIGAVVLAYVFDREYKGFFSLVGRAFGESLTAGFLGAFAAYATLVILGTVTFSSTLGSILMRGGLAGIAGLMVAAFVYYALGNREFSETVQSLARKIWRGGEPISSAEDTSATHSAVL